MAANGEGKKSPSSAEEEKIQVPATDSKEDEKDCKKDNYYRSFLEFHFGIVFSDDDSDSIPYPKLYTPAHDPQSDSDSDSESSYANKLPAGKRFMTEAEEADYEQQIKESKGFDFPVLENVIYTGIAPVEPILLKTVPLYARAAKEALELHRRKTGQIFELVEIVKANDIGTPCGAIEFYFTLRLRDERGLVQIYRAHVQCERPGTIEMPIFEEFSGVGGSGSCTSDSRNSTEMDVICNDNSGAAKGDENVVRATRKRSFASTAE